MQTHHCRGPFRLFGWTIITVLLLLLLGILRPEQLQVVLYKLSLVTLGAVLGYWIDRAMFPYARPHTQISCNANIHSDPMMRTLPALLMLRRAVVVFACIIGLTLGL